MAKSLNEQDENSSPFVKVGECLYRRRTTKGYYALLKHAGKQVRRSLKTTDPALAKRRLADLKLKIGALSKRPDAASVSFDELANRWLETLKPRLKPKSFQRRQNSINQLRPYIGTLTIKQLSPEIFDRWESERSPGIAASTFNNERESIISVLDYAKRDGLVLENPALVLKRRKLPKSAVWIPTKEQFSLLVKTLRISGPRFVDAADLVELLAYSGMRLTEATSMRWRDIDFENGRFVVTGGVTGTKNHEERVVPLFPTLRTFLEKVREEDAPKSDQSIVQIGTAIKALASACKKAGIPRFTHHTLRHFFVSNAIELGIDFKTIASWVGHKDGGLLVAKTYGHLRDHHSNEMAQRMTFSA
ncbi:MAG: tyrosine-type recombinase/integrase [Opitutaceae bacterium]